MKNYWITLKGQSMSPLLHDLDQVLITPIILENLKCGDIVLFIDQSSKELTLHRLINFPFCTKGDFSLCFENNPSESFLGKAIGFRRDNIYRVFPSHGSLMNRCYMFFSIYRMKGFFLRKWAYVFLVILTMVFEFCSEKTKLDHNKEQMLIDP